ncbi:MAG: YchJ family metal-binding protein [Nannocystaceae bacterium]
MARNNNAPCPCGSGIKFKRCCLPLHLGAAAATPEALMRSRYAAYAVGDLDYVISTTDPEGPAYRRDRAAWTEELRQFAALTTFEALEIREVGPVTGDLGEVRFFARLRRGGADVSFEERSLFAHRGGRWYYVAARG